MAGKETITNSIQIASSIETVWECWNNPADIMQWNNTDEAWHNTRVENDLRPGEKFLYAMAKKDGSEKFDFKGIYDSVELHKSLSSTLTDGRKSALNFNGSNPVVLTEAFEAEPNLPLDMQQKFNMAVLENFKQYVEDKAR